MIKIRTPSLEFNWLPNSLRKSLPTPRLVISDDDRYGGFYVGRTEWRCVLEELSMDLSEGGVIALCANQSPACLAHEYRHHWQFESGFKFGASVWSMNGLTYEKSIVRFFKSYWWEMDALRFELKHAPCDMNMEWHEWIVRSN